MANYWKENRTLCTLLRSSCQWSSELYSYLSRHHCQSCSLCTDIADHWNNLRWRYLICMELLMLSSCVSEWVWVSVSECEWVWVSVSECEWVWVSVSECECIGSARCRSRGSIKATHKRLETDIGPLLGGGYKWCGANMLWTAEVGANH